MGYGLILCLMRKSLMEDSAKNAFEDLTDSDDGEIAAHEVCVYGAGGRRWG